jgi:hypothetical protein
VTGALGLRVTHLQRGRGLGTEQLSFISITTDGIVPVKRGGNTEPPTTEPAPAAKATRAVL